MARQLLSIVGVMLTLSSSVTASCYDYLDRMECEATDTLYSVFRLSRISLSALNQAYNPVNYNSFRGNCDN